MASSLTRPRGPSYTPAPLDTSRVTLPDELDALVERLARNTHEVWAAGRVADGWRYGPSRDDGRREHPDLVSYEQLPEDERRYDREVVLGVLRAALALGYRIEPAERHRAARAAPLDDMHDRDEELAAHPALAEALALCRDTVLPSYEAADREALAAQRAHRRITAVAAGFGTVAVLLALAQLGEMLVPGEATRAGLHGGEWIAAGLLGFFPRWWLAWCELGTAVIAIGAVALGVRTGLHDRWLVARHKAERLRLLKFRYLTAPALWSDSAEGRERLRRWLDEEVEAIAVIDRQHLRRWSEEEPAPEPPAYVAQAHIDEAALGELVRYQLHKRLALQTSYLAREAGRHRRREWRTRDLTRLLFLASVLVVGWHAAHGWGWSGSQPPPLGVLLIILAVAFPVLAAGLRTYRGAHEFARNTSRFHAKEVALRDLVGRLESERRPTAILRDLWSCEQVLESDHREWLRLMIDAEWYV